MIESWKELKYLPLRRDSPKTTICSGLLTPSSENTAKTYDNNKIIDNSGMTNLKNQFAQN